MSMLSTTIQRGAEPIYRLNSSQHGVLFLHGYLGSPFEMKDLSQRVFEAGFSISVPRYPGHGTSLEDLTTTFGTDWLHAAREACMQLQTQCRRVSIVGLSMGAALAVLLAGEFEIQSIALLSMPASISQKSIYITPLLKYFKKAIYRSDADRASFNRGINDPAARARHVGYFEGIPIAQA